MLIQTKQNSCYLNCSADATYVQITRNLDNEESIEKVSANSRDAHSSLKEGQKAVVWILEILL